MKRLKTIFPYNYIHFLVIPILLIGLIFKHFIFIIPLALYYIHIYRNKILVCHIAIISVIVMIVFLVNNLYKGSTDNNFKGIVVDIDDNKYTIKSIFEKTIVYSNDKYDVGDILFINGNQSSISEETYEGGFSYKDFLNSKRIYSIYKNPQIEKKEHINTVSYYKYRIINYLSEKMDSEALGYITTLVFGYNQIEDESKENISKIGISHLFAVSGFHINLIYIALGFILGFIKKENIRENIIISFFIIYIFITSFSISVLRASIMIILSILIKRYNLLYTSLDILSFSIMIVLFINPLSLYQNAFILTYLITFFLIIAGDLVKDDNKIIMTLKTTILAFFSSFPLIININHDINLLSIILIPMFTIIVGYILLPMSFLSLIMPFIANIGIFKIFNTLLEEISNINIFIIRIAHINIIFIFIYYILFFIILIMLENKVIKRRYIFISVLYMLLLINIKNLNLNYKVTMIDVGQGDSMLISLPNNKGHILIDSYGYNIDYLKHLGISKIDYLIISHSDLDHIGSVDELYSSIKINNTYTSVYDNYSCDKLLKVGDVFYLEDIKIEVLSPLKKYDNKNDNSLVLLIDILGFKLLTVGDMGVEVEADLIKKYNKKLKADILKVGHHGSITSSSIDFINYVDPEYSLISLGKDNKYGFPSDEVLNRLNRSTIYRTDISGNIDVIINKNKIRVKPYR